ncbi:MAG: Beta-lactamase [Proteobacteria bacterium]|nr:Beta-lactamase [Pseudomonadota bacterium]
MKYALIPLLLSLMLSPSPLRAAENCTIGSARKSEQSPGPWIDQNNWLDPENLRFSLSAAGRFMPLVTIKSRIAPQNFKSAPKQLDLEKMMAIDPLDRETRDVGFLLDTRLYADGFIVLRNGRLLSEQYWHGISPKQPRLLLGATRPILSLLGAMAVAQGKFAPDKSVIRYIPSLTEQTGLRKLSIQRLIDANSRFEWTAQEINEWQMAGGWKPGIAVSGIRAWLNHPGRWERGMTDAAPSLLDTGPDGDLLTWALSESYREPLAQIFCDNILAKLRPENPAFWLTDPQGTELTGGLALSLRDFARFGQMLLEARVSGNRSRIPSWFIETLTTSNGPRKTNSPELFGLSKGSEARYGFVHLGGTPNRVALLGPYGNSLYIDFDRRLVIALFAAYPKSNSPAMLATLEQIWDQVGPATQPDNKR